MVLEPDLTRATLLEVEADDSLNRFDDEADPRSDSANMPCTVVLLEQVADKILG